MAVAVNPGGVWTALAPLLFVGIALIRNARARSLKIETLWVMPVVILGLIGLSFSQQKPPSMIGIVADAAALAIGAGLGWWRGRFTHIAIDSQTHALTSKSSPVGLLLVAGIFALRFLVRDYATAHAGALHTSVAEITDAFLLLAAGLMVAQRLEIWTRARKLLADARAC